MVGMSRPLSILYRDEHFVAIDKPAGMFVHRTRLGESREPALQRLRDQIEKKVFPIHRLDRAASGVLLFGLSSEAARAACRAFERRQVIKRYWAVVRGYAEAEGLIDYPLCEEEGRPAQPARTAYRRLATVEVPVATGRHAGSRYSLVEATPETGRRHQIRKHLCHIFHPIIGDTTYGEGRHNRLFRERFGSARLLLRAQSLELSHPMTGRPLSIEAGPDPAWENITEALGWRDRIVGSSTGLHLTEVNP